MRRVLGVDVASASWSNVGTAAIDFDAERVTKVVPAAITWPNEPLTPRALARAIDRFARRYSVSAVALDGPQGWRDPETSLDLPGVGRRCEYLCRTPGKTGIYGRTYPSNQVSWIGFSVELFEHLLAFPNVSLSEGNVSQAADGYLVLECFPTSAWRSSGLRPLPAKGKHPPLDGYRDSLRSAYALPEFITDSHDNLQAVVAALCAIGAVGGPVLAAPKGVVSRVLQTGRVEGLIWDVTPTGGPVSMPPEAAPVPAVRRPLAQRGGDGASVYVTSGVVAQVNRGGVSQMQIVLQGLPAGTKNHKVRVRLTVNGSDYALVVGDSHAAWRKHQGSTSIDSFERLFAIAADTPDHRLPISRFEILDGE